MLNWDETKGWGTEGGEFVYNANYWEEFRAKDATPMGRVLTALRMGFVLHNVGDVDIGICDVGIGGGAFVEAADGCGIDINEHAIEWLKENRRLWNGAPQDVLTFWDSIEHIPDPDIYIEKALQRVFLSTPIYEDKLDCLTSKHYKPGEHLWYFTDRGIKAYMADRGFHCMAQNRLEDDAGREGIGSYAFERR